MENVILEQWKNLQDIEIERTLFEKYRVARSACLDAFQENAKEKYQAIS